MPHNIKSRSLRLPALHPALTGVAVVLAAGLAAGSAAADPPAPATLLAAYSPAGIMDTAFDATVVPAARRAGTAAPAAPWLPGNAHVAGLTSLGAHNGHWRPALASAMQVDRVRPGACSALVIGSETCLAVGHDGTDALLRKPRRTAFSTIGITLRF